MSKYTCPACEKGFDTRNGKACPHCGVEIRLDQVRGKNNKIIWEAQLVEPAQAEPEPPAQEEGQRLTQDGEIPEIWYMGKREMANQGGKKQVDFYRVTYRGIIYTGWVYCPKCWRKMFQNTTMDSGWVGQEHFCRSCQTLTEYWFITKSQWSVR